jgi:hypothetical protein
MVLFSVQDGDELRFEEKCPAENSCRKIYLVTLVKVPWTSPLRKHAQMKNSDIFFLVYRGGCLRREYTVQYVSPLINNPPAVY